MLEQEDTMHHKKIWLIFVPIIMVIVLVIIIVAVLLININDPKKKLEETKSSMIEYVKSNMPATWSFYEEKVSINDDLDTEIKLYNTKDLIDCLLGIKKSYDSLSQNIAESSLGKVSFYCENGSKTVGHVTMDNIKQLKQNTTSIKNFSHEVILYDEKNQVVNTDENFFNAQKEAFASTCEQYQYKDIFRNPENYEYKRAKITGEIIQVMEDELFYEIRLNVTKNSYGWYEDTMFAYVYKDITDGRLLEDDIVTIYGELTGLITYKSIYGADITIPSIKAYYVELNN